VDRETLAPSPALRYKRFMATNQSCRPAAGLKSLLPWLPFLGISFVLALASAAEPLSKHTRSPRFPSNFLGLTISESTLAEAQVKLGPAKEFAWEHLPGAYEPLMRAVCYKGADGAAVAFESDFAERPGVLAGFVVSSVSSAWWSAGCSTSRQVSRSSLVFAGLRLGTTPEAVKAAYGPPLQYNDGAYIYGWVSPRGNARSSFSLQNPSISTSVGLAELELRFGTDRMKKGLPDGGATMFSFYQGPLTFPAIKMWLAQPVNGRFPPPPAPDVSRYAVLGLVVEHSTMNRVERRFGPAKSARLAPGDAGGVCYLSVRQVGTAIAFRTGQNGDFDHPWNVQLISSGASVPWRSRCVSSAAVSAVREIGRLRLGMTEGQVEKVLGRPRRLTKWQLQNWDHIEVRCGSAACRELRYEWEGHRSMTWPILTACVLAWGRACLGTVDVDLTLTLDFSPHGLVSVYVSDVEEPENN
jgi:hypothetical protein